MFHHGTIRKYTAALLNLFNDLEIQYDTSSGAVSTRKIPIKYSSREKFKEFDQYTTEQILAGNTNVLPRANLALSQIVKADMRVKNKNVKIASVRTDDSFEYMYNSVPYEFQFEMAVMCRGMNEASMVIEQVAPKFNPTVNIDIWDAENLDEPTRVPVKLLDIVIEQEEYEELSSNLVTVEFGFSIMGNLYQPIKSIDRIKDFKMYINQQDGNFFSKKSILGWDVNGDGNLENNTLTQVEDTVSYPPNLIDIVSVDPIAVGVNNISLIYDDPDNKLSELNFTWTLLSGSAVLAPDLDKAQLDITTAGSVEVQVEVTDAFGNFASISKIFNT